MMEKHSAYFIEKKWSIEELRKRIRNLTKIIPWEAVNWQLTLAMSLTYNERDALYVAYYNLKKNFSKINYSKFGGLKAVNYEQPRVSVPYNDFYNDYYLNNNFLEYPTVTDAASVHSSSFTVSDAASVHSSSFNENDYSWEVITPFGLDGGWRTSVVS